MNYLNFFQIIKILHNQYTIQIYEFLFHLSFCYYVVFCLPMLFHLTRNYRPSHTMTQPQEFFPSKDIQRRKKSNSIYVKYRSSNLIKLPTYIVMPMSTDFASDLFTTWVQFNVTSIALMLFLQWVVLWM